MADMDTYYDDMLAKLRGMYITAQPAQLESETPGAHEVELWQDLEHNINLVNDYLHNHGRSLRRSDLAVILLLLRNYRREKFGNPITDRERRE